MDFKTILGERVKVLRQTRKILQKDLAEEVGITKQSLSVFEKGSSSPSLDTLVKIANYFNVSVDYLLGRTDNPEINN
ncbi:XRE family transcriptional regulator [Brevibacillus gelatini]|uniref:XRE family transcriptional regulator n=1 Tax=Brevibacillus gelatini TaxID=1655277 RepID=A0A3M8ANB1_9BACL|nr:helix-turn-helix transcriptional regulator [Brevibacillus gelatini]RNB52681.1 XRE family transcriptional regulator [Brevibacillus gelatini]